MICPLSSFFCRFSPLSGKPTNGKESAKEGKAKKPRLCYHKENRKRGMDMDWDVKRFYQELDQTYSQGLEEVERFLMEGRRTFREAGNAAGLVAVHNELGAFYRGTSRYTESLTAFQTAGEEIVRRLGTDCVEYATLLNNMAGTYRLMGRPAEAAKLFRQAIDIYQNQNAENSYAFVSVLNNISLADQELGQLEEAAANLERALSMLRRMPGLLHEEAVTYHNLTALYHKMGRQEDARRCLEMALASFAEGGGKEDAHYAAALNSLAGFLYSAGDYNRAVETYRKAAKYTKRWFGENVEYAVTFQNMSWACQAMGEEGEARRSLEEAERVLSKLFGPEHERTQAVRDALRRLQGAAS